jgi:hypothetical protein
MPLESELYEQYHWLWEAPEHVRGHRGYVTERQIDTWYRGLNSLRFARENLRITKLIAKRKQRRERRRKKKEKYYDLKKTKSDLMSKPNLTKRQRREAKREYERHVRVNGSVYGDSV